MDAATLKALVEAGADVTLVAGPVHLPTPRGVRRIDVQSAQQMFDAVMPQAAAHDVFIATAVKAGLPFLVSGDKDLLEAPMPEGLTVLTPAQALATHT
jgi:predicted nucleic acid-binding protein